MTMGSAVVFWCCVALLSVYRVKADVPPASPNLAQGRPTWQSSTLIGNPDVKSDKAVDGNKNPNWATGNSCTHTGAGDLTPWLAVDLGQLTSVWAVDVTNRGDCCPERLNNFAVGLTNAAPNDTTPTLNNVVLCGRGPATAASGATMRVICTANLKPARYVVILSPQEYLSVCELEVYAPPLQNLALGKRVKQSSTPAGNDVTISSRAVDGNRNSNWNANSCTQTAVADANPWVAVDLGQITNVQYVNVVNRGDCCPDRLNNFVVGLTNIPPETKPPTGSVVCGRGPAVAPAGATITVVCTPALDPARYVAILGNQVYMTICELEVYGSAAGSCASSPCQNGGTCTDKDSSGFTCSCTGTWTGTVCDIALTNMALRQTAWQSTTRGGTQAAWAVDGNRNTNFGANSCTLTNPGDSHPWLAVDLGRIAAVQRVEVLNRGDCCPGGLNGFVVGLSNAVTTPTEANVDICGRGPDLSPLGANMVVVCAADLKPARYVVIMTQQELLTICELEVWASAVGACSSSPCKNGGTCRDTSASAFSCTCTDAWNGVNCGTALTNMAAGRTGWMSSVYNGWGVNRAVEGVWNTDVNQGQCAMTQSEVNPWLAIDLTVVANVQRIAVVSMIQGQILWLNGFIAGLTNNPPATTRPTVDNMAVCGRAPDPVPASSWVVIPCVAGLPPSRYVVITLQRNSYLALCELQVFASAGGACAKSPCKNGATCTDTSATDYLCACTPTSTGTNCDTVLTNMALRKTTWQSSMQSSGTSDRVVDGNKGVTWGSGSCMITEASDTRPWMAVDLTQIAAVQRVEITTCNEDTARMANCVIGLTNTPPTVTRPTETNVAVCARGTDTTPAAGTSTPMVCAPGLQPARYVAVMTSKVYLQFCELEVWAIGVGACTTSPCKNGGTCSDTSTTDYTCQCALRWGGSDCTIALTDLAQGQPAFVSSVHTSYPLATADKAVDGNRMTNMASGSCTLTKDGDNSPWFAVDLGQPVIVQSVDITASSAGNNNYLVVRLTNTAPTDTPPTTAADAVICGRINGGVAAVSTVNVLCAPGLRTSRYVAITTPQASQSLCEVEVWGLADPCVTNPCKNGAKCKASGCGSTYSCLCAVGWAGPDCSTATDPCVSKPCKNGGKCTKVSQLEFSCTCVAGWKDKTCESEVNVCTSSNPCKNGGTCMKFGNGFECHCTANWAGATCETSSKQCKMVAAAGRYNCGWGDITAAQCNERSCCYDDSVSNAPWCFYSTFSCDDVKDAERVNCGMEGISYVQCTGRGCCYDDDTETNKGPVCFRKANPACVGVDAGDRVKQGSDSISANECNAKGWCYDTSADPNCFTRK